MSGRSSLTINGRTIQASHGDTLVEAALAARLLIPHDCCSGQCETCRVRLISGELDPHGSAERDTVLACQARVTGDAVISFEEVPDVVRVPGIVTDIAWLSVDVMEVVVTLKAPFAYLPGQYVNVTFAGFPGRDFSPTPRADGSSVANEIVLHVRRLPDGIVSSELGRRIALGHKVRLKGPYGYAFHRKGQGRLVLVAGGTGWAPIWAVAREACRVEPGRPMVVVTGARDAANLYMRPSLAWLAARGVRDIVTTSELDARGPVRRGRPNDHLPALRSTDMVYVAGAQGLVNAVKHKARAADAVCYTDPFLPGTQSLSLYGRMTRFLRGPAGATVAPAVVSPRPAVPVPEPAPEATHVAPFPTRRTASRS